ncbi:MAG: FAD-binding protein [Myxococcales bacterium]|nr:FAD-binding protein [Myxococcales bacterium]
MTHPGLDRARVRDATLRLALPLARRVGDSHLIDDPELLAAFGKDESHVPPATPDLVLKAQSEAHVIAALQLAAEYGVPVVPRGAGTGKSGGAIPIVGGLVLDTTALNQVLDVDRHNLLAVVQPGLITGDFQAHLEGLGLFYPPDPNSLETCTLGGNAAHNAGGPRAFKYGVTRNYVMATRTALMGGDVLATGTRTIKRAAGYDLTSLLVGSEGTLGVFTELTLRLVVQPTHLSTLLICMGDEPAAGRAIAQIIAAGLVPRVLEFMDGTLVQVLREEGVSAIAPGTGALILAEIDGTSETQVEADTLELAERCEDAGALQVLMARHGAEREQLWAARRLLSEAIKSRGKYKVSEDIVVPRAAADELLQGLRALNEKHSALVAAYGHAGDGNFHVNILWDDPDYRPDAVVDDVFALVWSLRGTITGEHGVGLSKKAYLPKEQSAPLIDAQRRIKHALDPLGLLNPAKIFAP